MFALAHRLPGADSDRRARRLAQYRRYNYSEKGRARNARYDATPAGVARKQLYERTIRAMMRAPGPRAGAMVLDLEEPSRVRALWGQVLRVSIEHARRAGGDPQRIADALRWASLPARLLNPPTAACLTGPDDLLLRPSEWGQLSQGVASRIEYLAERKRPLSLPEISRIGRALALLRTDHGVRALASGALDAIRQLAAPSPRQLQLAEAAAAGASHPERIPRERETGLLAPITFGQDLVAGGGGQK